MDIDDEISPCLCQRIFNWQPRVQYHKKVGRHPNPGPFDGGEREWHWYRCHTCETATEPFDNKAAATAFWEMLNRPEQHHMMLWKRDFDKRNETPTNKDT